MEERARLSGEILEILPGLVKTLDPLIERGETVSEKPYRPDIQAFGEEIRTQGEKSGGDELSALGKNVLLHIDSYDIEQITPRWKSIRNSWKR